LIDRIARSCTGAPSRSESTQRLAAPLGSAKHVERGVIVEAYNQGYYEVGYQDMFIMYKDTDDLQHFANAEVRIAM
jgi:hypothetical protein